MLGVVAPRRLLVDAPQLHGDDPELLALQSPTISPTRPRSRRRLQDDEGGVHGDRTLGDVCSAPTSWRNPSSPERRPRRHTSSLPMTTRRARTGCRTRPPGSDLELRAVSILIPRRPETA